MQAIIYLKIIAENAFLSELIYNFVTLCTLYVAHETHFEYDFVVELLYEELFAVISAIVVIVTFMPN